MIKYKHICDKCKKEVEQDTQFIPRDWVELEYRTREFGRNFANASKLLCEQCSKEFGIVRDYRQSEETHNKSIGDRLVEILSEIAQGAKE